MSALGSRAVGRSENLRGLNSSNFKAFEEEEFDYISAKICGGNCLLPNSQVPTALASCEGD